MREYVIGTGETCDIRINDEYVSNRHCRIWEDEAGQVWIDDLGSTNGTWLNGGPSTGGQQVYLPTPIGPGVVVHIGHTDIPWTPR